ncbi:MAG: TPM domain-containing protein [Candidatus Eiseniibacteriota bacterium]
MTSRRFVTAWAAFALAFAAMTAMTAMTALPARAQRTAPDTAEAPELGRAVAYVTDEAELLTRAEELRIDRYLGKVERELGTQFALVIVPTTGSKSIEETAVELFNRWGIGGKKLDEGLLLLVAVRDRKIRFEVGYGLEGSLPDGRVGGIIRQQITPAFRQERFGEGLLDGLVEAARYVAEDKGLPPPLPDGRPAPARRSQRNSPFWAMLFVFVIVIILFALISASNRGGRGGRGGRFYRGGTIIPGGWTTGGWTAGSGGWSGGSGGGFGGGASGGGFGGFGGGASGGGGATGGW